MNCKIAGAYRAKFIRVFKSDFFYFWVIIIYQWESAESFLGNLTGVVQNTAQTEDVNVENGLYLPYVCNGFVLRSQEDFLLVFCVM